MSEEDYKVLLEVQKEVNGTRATLLMLDVFLATAATCEASLVLLWVGVVTIEVMWSLVKEEYRNNVEISILRKRQEDAAGKSKY